MQHKARMTFAVLIVLMSALVMLEIAITYRQQARGLREARREPARLSHYPSISVIRPVRGADVGAAENYAAALDNGYPGDIETIFVFDDEADPGYPIACAAVAEHQARGGRGTASVITAGSPSVGTTGKLHAMMAGEHAARHELIAFGDSDTRPDQDVLRVTVETLLQTPNAGCAFAPVVCNQPPARAGDVGYATLVNMWYGPAVALAAVRNTDMAFIMGQLMVFTRDCLRRIGGVGCARGQLVDDMAIGKHVAEAGLRNVMAAHPLHIATGGMSYGQFFQLFRRWLLFSKNGLPFDFTKPMWFRGLEFWIAFAAFVLALHGHHYMMALAPLAALAAFEGSMLAINRHFGGAPVGIRFWWVPFVLPVVAPAAIVLGAIHKHVEWRGRDYALDAGARLAS
jgi:ceramide glucosyltransferase